MLAGFLQNHIDRNAAMQKVGWTMCFLYMYCFTEYDMRFRWSLRLAIGVQMYG